MFISVVLTHIDVANCLSCFHPRVNCLPAKSLVEGKVWPLLCAIRDMSVVRELHGIGFRGGGGVVAPLSGPTHFTEDAPRPPVPGEEGTDVDPPVQSVSTRPNNLSQTLGYPPSSKMGDSSTYTPSSSSATPRRPDLDLGYEPEGSASPTPPYLKWAESLHSLLDDQEGIHLFRNFLHQEGCVDLLDFWFACSGFRKTSQEKRTKLAKAIYRKYIVDGSGIVSRQIKAATKSFIRDCLGKPHPDPAMFEQVIKTLMFLIVLNKGSSCWIV